MSKAESEKVTVSSGVGGALVLLCGGAVLVGSIFYVNAKNSAPAGAVRMTAQVSAMEPSSCQVLPEHHVCPTLRVEVFPAQGPRYQATIEARLDEMWSSRVQPGSWLTVLVDPQEPSRVFVDVEALALPAPSAVRP